jgi:hypothetical protein
VVVGCPGVPPSGGSTGWSIANRLPVAAGPGWPVRSRLLVGRMSGVVGCDEEAFAGAGHEGPVASGLQVVVVGTQRVQLVQPSMAGLRPGVPVVVFDPGPVTALDRAG